MLHRQTSSPADRLIIEAERNNYDQLADFLNQNNKIHRHLEWFSTLDWLGSHPFLLEQKNKKIISALCSTPENKAAAWVRLFGVRKDQSSEQSWQRLLPRAAQKLRDMNLRHLAALALHPWFEALLVDSGFITRQNIVVLEWQGEFPERDSRNRNIHIRKMVIDDLPTVQRIDQLAFQPLWQNSLAGLTKAYQQTGISTVAVMDNEIIGYQISTSMTIYGHLARLAVHPEVQRQGIAYTLVYNLLNRFKKRGFSRITVNTQSNNKPSLNLYKRFKFIRTSESIPVYEIVL